LIKNNLENPSFVLIFVETIKLKEKMKDFLEKAMEGADHHAKRVLNTIPTLYGNLSVRGCKFIKTRTTCLWVEIGDKPYYITYDHDTKQILFKNKNCRGNVVERFDDNMGWEEIRKRVNKL
jgi:hypothetical protein